MAFIDNGIIRVGIDLRQGGTISYISESGSSENVVNIHDLTSQDTDGNGIPDACECDSSSAPELAQIPGSVGGAVVGLVRNRVLGFRAGDPGQSQAIRVTFDSLPEPFDAWNGTELWVTEPQDVCDLSGVVDPANTACGALLKIAGLTCDAEQAFFGDLSELGDIYVQHPGIVPDGVYAVRVVDETCNSGSLTDFSDALAVQNFPFGDISGAFEPETPQWLAPDGTVGIPTDVLAAITAFSNTPGSVTKLRADIEPCALDFKVNISDIVLLLDAFRGLSYSFAPAQDGCPAEPCDT